MRRRLVVLMAAFLTLTAVGVVNTRRADAGRVSTNYSLSVTDDEIVMTSERLHDLEVHATVTFTVRRGAACTSRSRLTTPRADASSSNADGTLLNGGLSFGLDHNFKSKINDGEWKTWEMDGYDWDLEQEWERASAIPGI